ncbi:MAG: hypothetical protein JST85_28635 [Acidobacteria bacterium]|nr:hypothetical protein [Acidobacteriota bacterium]
MSCLLIALLCATQFVLPSLAHSSIVNFGSPTGHITTVGQWTKVGRIDSDNSLYTLYSYLGVLYAGVGEDGIFRSTDQGRTWISLNDGIPEIPFVGRYALDFVSSGTALFVASAGVYRLNEQGNGWIASSNGLPVALQIPLPIGALAVSGTVLVAAISSPAVPGPKVYRSTNQGQSWEPAINGLPNDPLFDKLAASDSTLLIETGSQGLYRSTDQGRTWSQANNGLGGFTDGFAALSALGNDFFAAIPNDGIYRSSDQEQSWAKVSSLKLLQSGRDQLEAVGSNLLAISEGKVYLSINRGSDWTKLGDDATLPASSKLAVSNGQIFTSAQAGGEADIYAGTGFLPAALALVSAASFAPSSVAPESIVVAFGVRLATEARSATELPLPIMLAGTSLMIKDSAGVERAAPLFFISPEQINFQIPVNTVTGVATVTVIGGDGAYSAGAVSIASIAPGVFTANANGQGAAAAVTLRNKAGGSQIYEPVAQWDATRQQYVSLPIDLGPESDQVYLILFGTGLRFLSNQSAASALLGGSAVPVLFIGPQGDFVGLDQINLGPIPRSLTGRGEVEVVLSVDGKTANTVKLTIR